VRGLRNICAAIPALVRPVEASRAICRSWAVRSTRLSSSRDEFVAAVRRVAGGGSTIDPSLVAELFSRQRRADSIIGASLPS
jgi:DNA-binding NarL/FixJ family response regulator